MELGARHAARVRPRSAAATDASPCRRLALPDTTDRAHRRAHRAAARRVLLREHDDRTVQLEPRHPLSGVAARTRRGRARGARSSPIYYSLTAPSKGGPTLRALPAVGDGAAATGAGAAPQARADPRRIPPAARLRR